METGIYIELSAISTHALTEGDHILLAARHQTGNFNSRPHGGRPCLPSLLLTTYYFNSRPHGGRRFLPGIPPLGCYFNSRPHGGRLGHEVSYSFVSISTHALTEGDTAVHTVGTLWQNFNSRPHGGRPICFGLVLFIDISTHALTEGDGKFRQIFLLNRGYAYSISLYFLPHFISLLPQILSFQQKSFKFQVRIFLLFSVHLAFALQNQCVHHVKYRFCTNMFYFVFVLFTQIVKPQTIGLFIYDFF